MGRGLLVTYNWDTHRFKAIFGLFCPNAVEANSTASDRFPGLTANGLALDAELAVFDQHR